MDVHELLLKVQNKEMDLNAAEEYLKKLPYEDLGFAKLDHHRALRSGFGEVVYCAGKTTEHLVKIFQSFSERKSNVLGTRASKLLRLQKQCFVCAFRGSNPGHPD